MKLVIKYEGQPATTSEVIAANTENQHKNVLELIRQYQPQLEELGPSAFETRKSSGRPTEVAILNEHQSTFLLTLMRNSDTVVRFKLALVKAFYEMRNSRNTGPTATVTAALTKAQIEAGKSLIKGYAELLNPSKVAIAGAFQRLEAKAGLIGILPHYVAEGPDAANSGSEAPMSATELLKRRNIECSAQAFNKLLHAAGFLEEKKRPSTKGEKKFWSITDPEYGRNETSPNNPRETQPLWYESKFDELLSLVIPSKPELVA